MLVCDSVCCKWDFDARVRQTRATPTMPLPLHVQLYVAVQLMFCCAETPVVIARHARNAARTPRRCPLGMVDGL